MLPTSNVVLVIDDDEGLQESLEALLELEGYQARAAHDGIQALEALREIKPALILLDVMMPRMNGYELVAEMRRRQYLPGIPIILLTADGRPKEKATHLGVDGYVGKPFEIDAFLMQIHRFLP